MTDFTARYESHFDFRQFISQVLAEDIGDGDHTSLATISASQKGRMQLLAKEEGVLAGVAAAVSLIKVVDRRIKTNVYIVDGKTVKRGDIVMMLEGNARKLLSLERLLLNIMQRMSGIATRTAALQRQCTGTHARVIDTRKTTPGFRFFEKWAVEIGGGSNHRFGLFDMILIKDNHIDFAGGVAAAIDAANNYIRSKKKKLRIEIEARSLKDVRAIIKHGGVHRIMLDNFTVADTRKAVQLIRKRFETESSGGITEENIRTYALAGVDFISVGALTHHVRSLDMSLKVIPEDKLQLL